MPEDRGATSTQEAFAAVALAHYAALYNTAKRLTQNPSDAQDLVQETYLRAYRFLHRFAPGPQAKAWLFTILRHAHIDTYRQRSRQPAWVDFAAVEPFYADTSSSSAWMDRGIIEETLEYVVQDEVQQALETLPEAFRQVVLLADLEECSYNEIAARVGCPVGTVMSRLFRGRRLLRRRLETFAREAGYIKSAQNDAARPPGAGLEPVFAH